MKNSHCTSSSLAEQCDDVSNSYSVYIRYLKDERESSWLKQRAATRAVKDNHLAWLFCFDDKKNLELLHVQSRTIT